MKRSTNHLRSVWLKRGTSQLEKLFRIISIYKEYTEAYHNVQRWHQRILGIAHTLQPVEDKTSEQVKATLASYLDETEDLLQEPEDSIFLTNLRSYSNGFWKGLFTCYNHPIIPRTNNDLELFFHEVKRKHRRITGLRQWNRYIMRHGEMVVLTEEAIRDGKTLERLQHARYESYKVYKAKWKNRTFEHTRYLRFKKDPKKYLSDLESRWLND